MRRITCIMKDVPKRLTFPGADEDTWPFGHVICEDERKRRMSQPPGFDEKAARRVEAVYTTADVVAQRKALLEMVLPGRVSACSIWAQAPAS